MSGGCSVAGCVAPEHARSLCNKHYKRWKTHGDPNVVALPKRRRVDPRMVFAQRTEVAPSGCWHWTGRLTIHGYGSLSVRRRPYAAHRFAYELLVGPIPPGMDLDHLCRVRHCVNPEHLEPVTERENCIRGEGPAAKNARKTNCVRGHDFTPENTAMVRRSGGGLPYRRCRECSRLKSQQRRAAA